MEPTINQLKALRKLESAARSSGGAFAFLTEYESGGTGRIASYFLRLGVTRAYVLEQSILWAGKTPIQAIADQAGVSFADASKALDECKAAWAKSLKGDQRPTPFTPIAVTPGGLRVLGVYTKDGIQYPEKGLYIRASIDKAPIEHLAGTYPPKNFRSDLTKCKAWIRRKSPDGDHREFKLTPTTFTSFTFGSETLTPQGLISVVEGLKRQA